MNLLNGNGLTPLLCAIKNHLNIEEDDHKIIDNKLVIEILFKNGADPFLTVSLFNLFSANSTFHLLSLF